MEIFYNIRNIRIPDSRKNWINFNSKNHLQIKIRTMCSEAVEIIRNW